MEVVLITGASSGIGEATAYAFAREKSGLFLVARRLERLEAVAGKARENGAPRAVARAHDLSVPGKGSVIVQECLSEFGHLDVLICNAGYGIVGPVQDIPPADMARMWQVNFQSAYESIHAALPHFLSRRSGHIVLTSSIVGKKAMPFSTTYCATKFAQIGLGEGLWGELKPKGIHVSVVCPGYTSTEFQQSVQRAGRVRPLNRPTKGQSPEVVAAAILKAVRKRRREVHLTGLGRLLLAIDRLSPGLATWIAATVGRRERE